MIPWFLIRFAAFWWRCRSAPPSPARGAPPARAASSSLPPRRPRRTPPPAQLARRPAACCTPSLLPKASSSRPPARRLARRARTALERLRPSPAQSVRQCANDAAGWTHQPRAGGRASALRLSPRTGRPRRPARSPVRCARPPPQVLDALLLLRLHRRLRSAARPRQLRLRLLLRLRHGRCLLRSRERALLLELRRPPSRRAQRATQPAPRRRPATSPVLRHARRGELQPEQRAPAPPSICRCAFISS